MASPVLSARYYRRCAKKRHCSRHSGDVSSATSDEDGLSDYGIDVDEDEGLETSAAANKMRYSSKLTIPTPRMDTYRFSMANMEDSQDIELDAILGELCVLENQFDRDIMPKSLSVNHSLNNESGWKGHNNNNNNNQRPPTQNSHFRISCQGADSSVLNSKLPGHVRSNSGGGIARPKFELGGLQMDMYAEEFIRTQKSDFGLRTDSPDNDSAFSDNVSMLSSESSASSGGLPRGDASSRSISSQSSSMSLTSSPTQVEQAARIKAEKIKIALEKMKEASIKKLFIKAFTADNSAKSLLIDERMSVGQVCRLLAEKNHVTMDTKWGLVEHIPELYMERVYEDHEHLVENLLLWTRDSCNQLLFLERDDKYDLFRNPQDYLLGGTSSEKDVSLDDEAKATLIEEFFSSSGIRVPEVEGPLYLKSDGKKAWKKHFFVLRASGLYYSPKGKSKLSKDLLCLTTFEMNNVYFGLGWRKKYKAPTHHGFAIKHPQIQTKSSKYIKYLCAEDESSLKQWVMGIRIAKYAFQLKDNYENLLRDIEEDDLDNLAHARSFSISSMAKTLMVSSDSSESPSSPKDTSSSRGNNCIDENDTYEQPTTIERIHKGRIISRRDSIKSSKSNKSNASSSSGCLSERSSTGTPTADQIAFEADYPMGTIKRKPNMTPKIPLTNTTRNIAKQSVEDASVIDNMSTIRSSGSGGSLCGSLGRATGGRFSLRRSKTDDRISFNSLSRKTPKRDDQETLPIMLLPEEFPLPPPPLDLRDSTECLNFDTLPPPPPEAFRGSTLSLDTLPPPPPPPTEETNCSNWVNEPMPLHNGFKESDPESSCSVSPTSPTEGKRPQKHSPAVPPKPRKGLQRRQSENDALSRSTPSKVFEHPTESIIVKPKPSKHKLNLDLSSMNCCESEVFDCSQHSKQQCASPKLMHSRRTSAPCAASSQLQVHSVFSPTTPTPTSPKPTSTDRQSRSQHKPSPPKRSENTKLSTSSAFTAPQRRSASASAAPYNQNPECPPPESFLRDLQKVMVRKWKVAQQLSLDGASSSHPILGFRDPSELPKPLQKPRCPRSPSSPPPLPSHADRVLHPKLPQHQKHHVHTKNGVNPKKQPPPPPPKRNDDIRW